MLRPNTQSPSDRNRWIVGGIAGLSVAAAVIALIFVTRPDDPTTTVPATQPTTFVPETEPATTRSRRRPPRRRRPHRRPRPHRRRRPSPTTAAGDHGRPGAADPGDRRDDRHRDVRRHPARHRRRRDRRAGRVPGADRAPRCPTVASSSSGDRSIRPGSSCSRVPTPTCRCCTLPADFTGQPVLHDAAVVNGEVVLLVESAPGELCTDPNTCIGSVWAVWPDRTADAAAKLDEQIVWEAGVLAAVAVGDRCGRRHEVGGGLLVAVVGDDPRRHGCPDRPGRPRAGGRLHRLQHVPDGRSRSTAPAGSSVGSSRHVGPRPSEPIDRRQAPGVMGTRSPTTSPIRDRAAAVRLARHRPVRRRRRAPSPPERRS